MLFLFCGFLRLRGLRGSKALLSVGIVALRKGRNVSVLAAVAVYGETVLRLLRMLWRILRCLLRLRLRLRSERCLLCLIAVRLLSGSKSGGSLSAGCPVGALCIGRGSLSHGVSLRSLCGGFGMSLCERSVWIVLK